MKTKMKTTVVSTAVVGAIMMIGGCIPALTLPEVNQNPVAKAGPDITSTMGNLVTLDASGSSDSDGDSLTYSWIQTSGPTVGVLNPNQMKAAVITQMEGTYEFTVTVSDGSGGSGSDVVRVNVGGSGGNVSPTPLPTVTPSNEINSVTSKFDTDDDGWRVQGGSFAEPTAPKWVETGSIKADGEVFWYWIAPDKFHGDFSSAYGKTLSFDQMFDIDRTFSGFNKSDEKKKWVVLSGGGYSLYYSTYRTSKTFSNYAVKLHESEDWYDESTGKHATQNQMVTVLQNLSQIKILGTVASKSMSGTSMGGLDNVVLKTGD